MSLEAVFANAPDDVWMVGSRGDWRRPETLALHFDGRSVRVVPTPNPHSKENALHGVAAFGPRDVWVVGAGVSLTDPVNRYVPLVLRYDGRGWVQVATPDVQSTRGAELFGISGSSGQDIWAVGSAFDDARDDRIGLIEHWDGERWRVVSSPRSRYRAVTAISRNDAWAAGITFNSGMDPNFPTAHWDGRTWRLVDDVAQRGWETYANDVSASGPKNVWIVGQEAAGPLVERFDGRRFARVRVPFAHWRANYRNRENSYFEGVEAISSSNVWAVGTFGIEHYDGRDWHLSSRRSTFLAISAATPTDLWAVGGETVWRYTCA